MHGFALISITTIKRLDNDGDFMSDLLSTKSALHSIRSHLYFLPLLIQRARAYMNEWVVHSIQSIHLLWPWVIFVYSYSNLTVTTTCECFYWISWQQRDINVHEMQHNHDFSWCLSMLILHQLFNIVCTMLRLWSLRNYGCVFLYMR